MYLSVCFLCDPGLIPGRDGVFQGIFPWLITLCQTPPPGHREGRTRTMDSQWLKERNGKTSISFGAIPSNEIKSNLAPYSNLAWWSMTLHSYSNWNPASSSKKWPNLPSMAPPDLWTSSRKADVQSRTDTIAEIRFYIAALVEFELQFDDDLICCSDN